MKEEIRYGKQKIEFDLIYMDRKTLGITVHPDRSVEVKAPADASREKIFQKVRSRASWIVDQRRYFASFEPRRRPFLYKRSEEHTSELQSRGHLVCRLLLEKKKDD